jgi:hypothetical protein
MLSAFSISPFQLEQGLPAILRMHLTTLSRLLFIHDFDPFTDHFNPVNGKVEFSGDVCLGQPIQVPVVDGLVAFGQINRGWIGVYAMPAQELAKAFYLFA